MESQTAIQRLYEEIPASRCKPGCHACCRNSVQMAAEERERMGGYVYDGLCGHLCGGVCAVYEDRPFVCRLYGASELLVCEDCVPERYLSAEETRRLVHRYTRLCAEQEPGARERPGGA